MIWLRIAAIAIVLAGIGALGWWIKGKFDRAAEADRLEVELADTEARLKASVGAVAAADRARLVVAAKLRDAAAERDALFEQARKHAVPKASDSSECDLDVESIRLFNAARGYVEPGVPPAAAGVAPP
jgi:hypothetical protein